MTGCLHHNKIHHQKIKYYELTLNGAKFIKLHCENNEHYVALIDVLGESQKICSGPHLYRFMSVIKISTLYPSLDLSNIFPLLLARAYVLRNQNKPMGIGFHFYLQGST